MRTIEVPTQSTELNILLDQARNDDLLIRSADGSEFVLVAIDESDLEVARMRNNPRLMELLDRRAAQAASVPVADVRRQLGL